MRTLIRRILTGVGMYTEEFASAKDLLDGYSGRPLGVVLLDVVLPDMNGLELLQTLQRQPPPNPVIILSGHADIDMAVAAVKAGAIEVLQKPFRKERLLQALDQAFKSAAEAQLSANVVATLTPREQEILTASSDGAPTKVVAFRLGLSTRTVEMHRSAIVRKLGVKNMTQALLMAKDSGATG